MENPLQVGGSKIPYVRFRVLHRFNGNPYVKRASKSLGVSELSPIPTYFRTQSVEGFPLEGGVQWKTAPLSLQKVPYPPL